MRDLTAEFAALNAKIDRGEWRWPDQPVASPLQTPPDHSFPPVRDNRASTTSATVAAGAASAGLAVQAKRVNGATVFSVAASDLPDNESFESFGARNYATARDTGHAMQRVREAEAVAFGRESWARRHHAAGDAEPHYTRDELDRLSRQETEVEMPLIDSAIAAGRVAGFVKPVPVESTPTPRYTRSQLNAMHPRDMERQMPQIEEAQAAGAIDFSQ